LYPDPSLHFDKLNDHGEGSTVSLRALAGIYFVRVSDEEKSDTQKLVIE
jgi:hypothetical protein